jgi:hypothetical protein
MERVGSSERLGYWLRRCGILIRASAYAGLQLFVRDDSTGDVYVTTTDVYNDSADGFGFNITPIEGNLDSRVPFRVRAENDWGGCSR